MKHIIIILALLVVAGCTDSVTAPVTPVSEWKRVESFRSNVSGWLNFISVQADYDKPDSAKIVLVHDSRTAVAQELIGGEGSFIARFYFEAGYVSALPGNVQFTLHIK